MRPTTPHSIGRYEIVEPLATGGMATVYLARIKGPAGFTKLFALKTIHPHLVAEDGFIEMFLDEARIASRITHPNVCQIVDFGVGTGSYFIAMELLLGENLAKLRPHLQSADRGERHIEMMARIVASAAEGLHAAHEVKGDDGALLQVVHRDISHSNLFVTFDGVVKVVDFGIASAADQLHLTRTGTLKGKFAYMAPEQIEQQGIDRRADLWSLGVVLWELLTGQRLFTRARQVDSMRAVLDDPIPSASSVNPDVTPEMDAILARVLDRSPDKRYATALELAEALDALASAEGWTFTTRDLGEHMRHACAESFQRQAAMVASARSAPIARVETTGSVDEPTQTRQARPAPPASEREGAEAASDVAIRQPRREEPTRNHRRSVLVVALVVGTAGVAYFAGSQTTPATLPPATRTPATTQEAPADTGAPDASPSDGETPADAAAADAADMTTALSDETTGQNESAGEGNQGDATPSEMRPRRASGFVNITTPGGWADVLIGGRNVGRTPLRTRLPAGRRQIVLRPFGRGRVRRSVNVRARGATRLVVPVQSP